MGLILTMSDTAYVQCVQQITADIQRINVLRKAKEAQVKETTQEHLVKSQQFDAVQEKFRNLEIEDVNLRDKRKHLRAKATEMAKMMKLKEKDIVKYERVPSESESRIEELKKEAKKLEELRQADLNDQEKIQINLKRETEELANTKDLKSAELVQHQELITAQEAEIMKNKCDLELLVGTYEKDKLVYAKLESVGGRQ